MVGRAELLDLPRAVRLERVRRQDQPRAGELLDQAAGQVGVPGVAMDDVDVLEHPRHDQVAEHRLQELLVPGVLVGQVELGVDPPDGQVSLRGCPGRRSR